MADSGVGSRGPRVWNDRAGEVGRTLNAKDFDLDRIFGEEGAQIVHMSGLIAALSPESTQFCLDVARVAKSHGSKISFDLNHRATFWKGREEELSAAFNEIGQLSDILIGNEEDFQLCLGVEGPEAGGSGIAVPVIVEGPWTNLSYRPDLEALINQNLAVERAAAEAAVRAQAQEALKRELGVDVEAAGGNVEQAFQDRVDQQADELRNQVQEQLQNEVGNALRGLLGGN